MILAFSSCLRRKEVDGRESSKRVMIFLVDKIRIYNVLNLKLQKRDLRHRQTRFENILWEKLRRKSLGIRFHRQYSVGPYILDFYCPQKKIAVELDGYSHKKADTRKYDKFRTDFLSTLGIKTIRFWNSEVEKDLTNVLKKINDALNELPLKLPPL